MAVWPDIKGILSATFSIGGLLLKNAAGVFSLRNASDTADAGLTAGAGTFNGTFSVLNAGAANVAIVPGTYPSLNFNAAHVDFYSTPAAQSFMRLIPDSSGGNIPTALFTSFTVNDGPNMPSLGSYATSTSVQVLATSGRFEPVRPDFGDFCGIAGKTIDIAQCASNWFGTKYRFRLDAATLNADRGWKFPNANPAVGNVPRFSDTAGTIDYPAGFILNSAGSVTTPSLLLSSGSFTSSILPGTLAANRTVTLPTAAPVANNLLRSTNTSGVLAWSTGLTVDGSGNVTAPSYRLSALNTAPASATATGTLGEIRFASGFVYLCVATNTWQRAALSTW